MRIAIATLFGVVAGCICATFSFGLLGMKFSAVLLIWILLNRTVMGFAIGISTLKLHWAWNGILVGVVVGSIFSYWLGMNGTPAAYLTTIGNVLFGLLIEFFTTVVFKQPAEARRLAPTVAA